MKISFKKIGFSPKKFEVFHENLRFCGELLRENEKIVRLFGEISGELALICNETGENFTKKIHENIKIWLCDGIFLQKSASDPKNFDIIEFFDGEIDLTDVFLGEISLIKSEYHVKEDHGCTEEKG